MTIYSAISHSENKKEIFYLHRSSNTNDFYLAILPFEDESDSSFAQAACDMITKSDIDSIERNETKEHRSTVSFIPADKFELQILNEISKFCKYNLTNKTFLAIRMFVYDKHENLMPFFGTIKYENEIWKFIPEIQSNVFAYEYASVIDKSKTFVQPTNESLN